MDGQAGIPNKWGNFYRCICCSIIFILLLKTKLFSPYGVLCYAVFSDHFSPFSLITSVQGRRISIAEIKNIYIRFIGPPKISSERSQILGEKQSVFNHSLDRIKMLRNSYMNLLFIYFSVLMPRLLLLEFERHLLVNY